MFHDPEKDRHLKPHMTWKTAADLLLRRSWLLLLLAVIGATAGVLAARHQASSFKLTQTLAYHSYTLKVDPATQAVIYVPSKGQRPADNAVGNFVNLDAAQRVAPRFGLSGQDLLGHLSVVVTSGTEATVSYTAASKSKAAAVLAAYAQAWKAARSAALTAQIASARTALQHAIQSETALVGPNPAPKSREAKALTELRSELVKLTALDQNSISNSDFAVIGAPFVASSKQPVSTALAGAGGFATGLFLAALALLALAWTRGRIVDAGELEPLGVTVVDVNSSDAHTLVGLRAELEVAGIGDTCRTVAISTSGAHDRNTRLPLELARAFAQTGLKTALVSANFGADGAVHDAPGVADFLAYSGTEVRLDPLEDNLFLMHPGTLPPDGIVVTRDGVNVLLEAVSRHARVIVLETMPLLVDPSAIVFAHAADMGVLQVNKRRSSTDRVYRATLMLRRAVNGPVFAAFDRASASNRHLDGAIAAIPAPAAQLQPATGLPSGS